MSKKDQVSNDGLETAAAVVAEGTAKVKKVQTAEEKATVEAGVELMKTIGVSAKMSKVLALVADWNGEKEDLTVVKEAVIAEFGGSEELKNYIDGEFQTEIVAWQGISKALPILNNIKAFYARRESTGTTKKVKTVQVSIDGTAYNVDAAYREEIAALPTAEKKELLLAHPNTTKVEILDLI